MENKANEKFSLEREGIRPTKKTMFLVIGISAIVFIGLWLINPWITKQIIGDRGLGQNGQFGDSYGFVNSLFTGLGIVALVATFMQQQREISGNRLDLEEQKRQTNYRRFEDRFFKLLELHRFLYEQLKGDLHGMKKTL
jgi:hypothetical protein